MDITSEPPPDGGPDSGSGEGSDPPVDGPDEEADPLRFRRWLYTSALGSVAVGAARGLQDALTDQPRPAFVIQADRDGDDDDGPIHLELDPDDPTKAVAVIRRPVVPPPPPSPDAD